MNYCVLIQLTRNSITFWCQQQGAPYEPLAKKEGNVLPLYFYVNGNEFIIGSFALERYRNGDSIHAFGDYFKIIADPAKFFTIFGNQKHVKFLLYFAVEQYLSHFLNTVLYKNDSIEEYRGQFPLRFMFSSDIVQKERLLVESIFTESGYDNIDTIPYYKYLFEVLNSKSVIDPQLPVIILTGIEGNLYIELFKEDTSMPISEEVIEDQGADPRIKLMAKMLFESAVSITHSTLNEKNEIAHLLSYAKDFLNQESAIPRGDIILSDGTSCYIQLKKKELNERLLYYSGEEKIYKSIENLLKKYNIQNNKVQILLNGEDVNTAYYVERLRKKFIHVSGSPVDIQAEVLKLVFKNISDSNYLATKRSPPSIPSIPEAPPPPITPFKEATSSPKSTSTINVGQSFPPLPPPPPPPLPSKVSPPPPPPLPRSIPGNGSQNNSAKPGVKMTPPPPPPPPPPKPVAKPSPPPPPPPPRK